MNYAQLSANIQAYTENTETNFVAEIPVFVQQAEQRIFNSVQFPSLRSNVTGVMTPSNKYLQCPTDFLAVYSLAVINASGEYEYLLNTDNPSELTFILGPTPDAGYSSELHYFFYPPSITVAPFTSWLGDNFDPVLLYGSLVEAYTYMKGETDMMALYNQKFMEALALAKRLGDGMERQDAYRSGQFRQAVT